MADTKRLPKSREDTSVCVKGRNLILPLFRPPPPPTLVPEANNHAPLLRNKLPRQGGMNLTGRSGLGEVRVSGKMKLWESEVCHRAGT